MNWKGEQLVLQSGGNRVSRVSSSANAEEALMKALYDEHAGALWRYALRLTNDASRAEDVVQETLLRAWQHPEVIGDT